MISSDFRAEARRKLAGKWGKVACISLANIVVFFLIGLIAGLLHLPESLASLINTIIEVPLAFGLLLAFFKVYNSEDVKAFDFFKLGFSNFKRSWLISLNVFLKMILPIILMIISIILISFSIAFSASSALLSLSETSNVTNVGSHLFSIFATLLTIIAIVWIIIKSYHYQLSYIIAIDNPDLSAKEAVNKSKEMMSGNCLKLFWLELSFIGWAILALLTFGIGMLWLLPYVQFAMFAFYFFLSGKNSTIETEAEVIEEK